MNETKKPQWLCAESAAALLLRLALGMLFTVAAIKKFSAPGGAAGVSAHIIDGFRETGLPLFLLIPFAYVLPYAEILIGLFLIVGAFSREVLSLAGLLLIVLAFGKLLQNDLNTVAANLNYVLLAAVALWFCDHDNRYALDYCLGRR